MANREGHPSLADTRHAACIPPHARTQPVSMPSTSNYERGALLADKSEFLKLVYNKEEVSRCVWGGHGARRACGSQCGFSRCTHVFDTCPPPLTRAASPSPLTPGRSILPMHAGLRR